MRDWYCNWHSAWIQRSCFTDYPWLRDARTFQTNYNQYTGVDITQYCQTPSKCGKQDQSETALTHWPLSGELIKWRDQKTRVRICILRTPYRVPDQPIRMSDPDSTKKKPWTKSRKPQRTGWTNANCEPDSQNDSSCTGAIIQAKKTINMWWFYLINENIYLCRLTLGVHIWDSGHGWQRPRIW